MSWVDATLSITQPATEKPFFCSPKLRTTRPKHISGEKLTSTLAKDTEVAEKELSCWMDKHAAIYRELETTYNEMSGY